MNDKIDFVMIWVDGNDLKWQKEKSKYDLKTKIDGVNGIVRYRDWDNLKYWFRGVEKYASWVNKIYFITCGHLPSWLDISNPKLEIINHKDYIPGEFLPTFSANPIELNFHRIKELSEQFVFFNDDIFLLDYVKPSDFFVNGLPCDNYMEVNLNLSKEDSTFASMLKNNYNIINKKYNKRKIVFSNPKYYFNYKYGIKNNLRTLKNTLKYKDFVGIYNNHISQSFLKSTYIKLWKDYKEIMENTSSHKFRDKSDINQYTFRYYQLLEKKFYPRDFNLGKYYAITNNNDVLIDAILKKKYKIICLNDSDKNIDFEKCKDEINNAFSMILSEKCSFEK